MNHKDEGTVREQITALYTTFSSAFARRKADGLMEFFLPSYTITTVDKHVLDYSGVEKEVCLEMSAEWSPPRAMLFAVQDVQAGATGNEAIATVQVERQGKGAYILLRRDTWRRTPQGWRLRESVTE